MVPQFIQNLGTTEIFLILAVVVLLFGARKLPDLARGTGQALRIFKSETKGLRTDDEDLSPEKPQLPSAEAEQAPETRPSQSDGN